MGIILFPKQVVFFPAQVMQRKDVDLIAAGRVNESSRFPYVLVIIIEPWNQRQSENQSSREFAGNAAGVAED